MINQKNVGAWQIGGDLFKKWGNDYGHTHGSMNIEVEFVCEVMEWVVTWEVESLFQYFTTVCINCPGRGRKI